MAKQRYIAQWCIGVPDVVLGEEWDLDDIEYGTKLFTNQQAAINYAHGRDLNHEGKVYVEEYRSFHDDEFGLVPHWEEIEQIYIDTDGTTEHEATL